MKASIVDHIVPHKGNPVLFWSRSNLQSLCKLCHDRHKALLERRGVMRGCNENGMPLDPDHPWNKTG